MRQLFFLTSLLFVFGTSSNVSGQHDHQANSIPMQNRQEQGMSMQMDGNSGKQGKQYMVPPGLPSNPSHTTLTDSHIQSPNQSLTLADLIGLAEASNPTLRQAQLQIRGTMGKAIQAGLYPNPTLRYAAEQIGVGGTPGEFHGGILNQEIVTAGKLRLSRAKFLQRVKAAEAMAVAQQFRVTNDVKVHFFNVLAIQQQLTVQHELVKSAEDSAVTAREAYNMGQANVADTRRANVSLQRTRLQLLKLENSLGQAKRDLASLVGADISQCHLVGQLESTPMNIDFESLYANLIESSPEILAARAKLCSDRIAIERERVEPIPNISLEGGAGYNFEADETVAVAGVSLKLPIFDRNQGTIQQAQADYARQCAEIQRIQQDLKRRLAGEYQKYVTAVQHVSEYQQTILPELRETYRLVLESYKDNRIDWNEVLHAQTDYYTSRVEYADWLAQMRSSEVLIDGMLLRGGLMAAQGTTPPGHIDAVAKPR